MVQPETTASFGYWVRRRRLTLDLTQADLANRVGCATVTISKIERDERRPSRQMAELLAEYLSIPADERERFLAVALGNQAVDRLQLLTARWHFSRPIPMTRQTPACPPHQRRSSVATKNWPI